MRRTSPVSDAGSPPSSCRDRKASPRSNAAFSSLRSIVPGSESLPPSLVLPDFHKREYFNEFESSAPAVSSAEHDSQHMLERFTGDLNFRNFLLAGSVSSMHDHRPPTSGAAVRADTSAHAKQWRRRKVPHDKADARSARNAMSEQGILIAGGYGVVGQRIAAALAPDYPVIVAGRHLEQGASATVRALMEVEVSEPGAWMPEQVIDPPGFFSHLARHGLTIQLPAA